jgi:hypothetical protein
MTDSPTPQEPTVVDPPSSATPAAPTPAAVDTQDSSVIPTTPHELPPTLPISFARSIMLSPSLKRMKRKCKKLFQQAFEKYFQDSFEAKQISFKPAFHDNIAIPVGYFTKQIQSYMQECKDNGLTCEFFVVKTQNGDTRCLVVRFISQRYFFQDPKTETSWAQFKDFFYCYDTRLKLELRALKAEIGLYEALRKIFKKCSSGPLTYSNLNKLVSGLFPPENPFWKLECWQPDYAQHLVTEPVFFDKYMPGKSAENLKRMFESLETGLQPDCGHKTLPEILVFSNDEVRADIPTYEILGLAGLADPKEDSLPTFVPDLTLPPPAQTPSSTCSESTPAGAKISQINSNNTNNNNNNNTVTVIECGPHVTFDLPEDKASEKDKEEDNKDKGEQKNDEKNLPGLEDAKDSKEENSDAKRLPEKNLVVDLLQQVSEARVWSARVQRILDLANSLILRSQPNLSACEFLAAAITHVAVGFDQEEDVLKIQLGELEQKHQPKKWLFSPKPISDEVYCSQKAEIEQSLAALAEEQECVATLFIRAIHEEVKKERTSMTSSTAPAGDTECPKLESTILLDAKKVPPVYTDVAPVAQLPSFLDYSSQLQAVENQCCKFSDVTGAAIATKTVKEWQEWDLSQGRFLGRLSAKFLERFTCNAICVDSLTQTLTSRGVCTEPDFCLYLEEELVHRVKSRAVLQSRAALHMIDQVYVAPDIATMKNALALNGPCLVTLPVYDAKLALGFWTRPTLTSPILGYHTMVIVGYNDETMTVRVRNSLGVSWGTMGYTDVPYTDIMTSPAALFVLVEGTPLTGPSSTNRCRLPVKVVKVSKAVLTSAQVSPQSPLEKLKSKNQYLKRQLEIANAQLAQQKPNQK